MEWNKDKMIWFWNGQLMHTVNLKRYFQYNTKMDYEKEGQPFDQTFAIVIVLMLRDELQ